MCVLTGDLGEGVEGDRRHAELVHRPNHSKGVQRERVHGRRQGERSAVSALVSSIPAQPQQVPGRGTCDAGAQR